MPRTLKKHRPALYPSYCLRSLFFFTMAEDQPIKLSQLQAAMDVSPAVRAALKATDEMTASLLRNSYTIMAIDDAPVRDTLFFTVEEAQRWFNRTTAAEKAAIKQDAATACLSMAIRACAPGAIQCILTSFSPTFP